MTAFASVRAVAILLVVASSMPGCRTPIGVESELSAGQSVEREVSAPVDRALEATRFALRAHHARIIVDRPAIGRLVGLIVIADHEHGTLLDVRVEATPSGSLIRVVRKVRAETSLYPGLTAEDLIDAIEQELHRRESNDAG